MEAAVEVVKQQVDLFGVVKYNTLDELPDSNAPYWVVSRDGLYLRKQTTLGPCLLPEDRFPAQFESLGKYKDGYFKYAAPRIPAHIISQALDFFRNVFADIHAEAEVLVLLNEETMEFSLFVPYQVVSGGSVRSIYDQADLPEGLIVIGTIHSHCDFGAFH